MNYLFLVIGLGVLAFIITLLVCGLCDNAWDEGAGYGILLGFGIAVITLIIVFPKENAVTQSDYIEAIGAKTLLESESRITIDNKDDITYALDVLNDYQDLRDNIKKKAGNSWNGNVYYPETLEKYPEVKIDSLTLNKFK